MAAELEGQGESVAYLGLIDPYVPGREDGALREWQEDLGHFVAALGPVSYTHLYRSWRWRGSSR